MTRLEAIEYVARVSERRKGLKSLFGDAAYAEQMKLAKEVVQTLAREPRFAGNTMRAAIHLSRESTNDVAQQFLLCAPLELADEYTEEAARG